MRLLLALAAAAALSIAAPAFGEEEGAKPGGGNYVDLAPVALPVVVDNRVINYVFVFVRVNLSAGASGPKLQSKEPYFRDALVRAGHRTPFTRFDDYTQLDEAKIKAALMAAAPSIAGPGAVTSISFTSPQQPKRRAGLPKPKISSAH